MSTPVPVVLVKSGALTKKPGVLNLLVPVI